MPGAVHCWGSRNKARARSGGPNIPAGHKGADHVGHTKTHTAGPERPLREEPWDGDCNGGDLGRREDVLGILRTEVDVARVQGRPGGGRPCDRRHKGQVSLEESAFYSKRNKSLDSVLHEEYHGRTHVKRLILAAV